MLSLSGTHRTRATSHAICLVLKRRVRLFDSCSTVASDLPLLPPFMLPVLFPKFRLGLMGTSDGWFCSLNPFWTRWLLMCILVPSSSKLVLGGALPADQSIWIGKRLSSVP